MSEARQLILRHTVTLETEKIHLLQGLGRVLGEDIHAPHDIPYTDNSAMDGYGFSHETLQGSYLKVTGFLPAGKERTVPVAAGEAIKIMTGAPVPSGCDTVVPIEDVEEVHEGIRLKGSVKPGSHIRKKGENVKGGDRVIAAGTVIGPQEIGMLATLGHISFAAHRAPTVAIIATGDELVDIGATPGVSSIIDSNTYSIASQVMEVGSIPEVLGIARDSRESTREKIMAGLKQDLIVTSGGVSMGERDYVKEVIEELGGEIMFWKVNMKPGKPFAFAILQGKAVFALPGNPVAAMMTFEQFVRPSLLKMMGHTSLFRPQIKATVTGPFRNKGDRPHLLLSQISIQDGRYFAAITVEQSSSNLAIMLQANGIIELAPGEALSPGAEVTVSLLNRNFEMRCVCQ